MVDFLEYAANSDTSVRPKSDYQVKQHTGSLGGNSLEDIVDKGVQNRHRLVGNTGIRMNLLQH
jgi:hypothetical protein